MKWRMLLLMAFVVFITGCPAVQKNVVDSERTIGPCYGSTRLFPGTFCCYYDVDGDKKPDIVLVYRYIDGGLELIDSFLVDVFNGR